MRDAFVQRMTWFAEYAPSQETADYLWRIIMDAKQFQVMLDSKGAVSIRSANDTRH